MSILKIARLGHPVLRRVAESVPTQHIPDAEIQRLIDDMIETLVDAGGAGLAAPQVHRSLRLVVLAVDGAQAPLVLINPEISYQSTDVVRSYEGCLSVPDLRGAVDRIARLRVEALDRRGERFVLEVDGFLSIAIQHECDHLDGMLYLDRVDTRSLALTDELRRHGPLDPSFRKPSRSDGDAAEAGDDDENEVGEPTEEQEIDAEDLEEASVDGAEHGADEDPTIPVRTADDTVPFRVTNLATGEEMN